MIIQNVGISFVSWRVPVINIFVFLNHTFRHILLILKHTHAHIYGYYMLCALIKERSNARSRSLWMTIRRVYLGRSGKAIFTEFKVQRVSRFKNFLNQSPYTQYTCSLYHTSTILAAAQPIAIKIHDITVAFYKLFTSQNTRAKRWWPNNTNR